MGRILEFDPGLKPIEISGTVEFSVSRGSRGSAWINLDGKDLSYIIAQALGLQPDTSIRSLATVTISIKPVSLDMGLFANGVRVQEEATTE